MWINLLGKSEIEAAGFQNDLIEMQDTGFLTPVVDSVKGNLIFMPGQIQCKVTEQPDAESAVKIVFQHVMDHIKHGFCWGTDFWLGKEYEMSTSVVLMCITVCVTQVLGLPLTIILGVSGLFKQERNLSVLTAIVNLAASLILIRYIGLAGVLLGTFLAYAIQIVYRVVVFFRQYLHRGCGRYVCDLLEYIGLILGETWLLCRFIRFIYHPGHLLSFMACFLLCCIIPLALNAVLYSRSWRFRSMRKLVKSFMGMRGGEANE